ncbi:MAG TPA: hypothetical protein VG942_14340 [Hyphomonadaceae bacterium]|nr:hypothetical protein [Hyphomonadaceae bacterium]
MRFGFAGFQDGYVARPIALLFIDMDANHDRVLTSDELAKGIAAEFDHADADHNGVISGFEMADWDKAVLGNSEALPNRAEMDVDLSSTISRNEFENALRKEFVAMDKDNDGKLTRAELLIEVPGRAEGPSGEVRNGDGGGQPQGGGGRGRGGGRRGGGGGGGQGPF